MSVQEMVLDNIMVFMPFHTVNDTYMSKGLIIWPDVPIRSTDKVDK